MPKQSLTQYPTTCPILDDVQSVNYSARDLMRGIRRLRRDVKRCKDCSLFENCPALSTLNASIQTALDEVLSEWNSEPIML